MTASAEMDMPINFTNTGAEVVYPVLYKGLSTSIRTPHGNILDVRVPSAYQVEVYDPRVVDKRGRWFYGFNATVQPRGGLNVLNLYIRTRDITARFNKLRHPDIRPRLLLPQALGYFAQVGTDPDVVRAHWRGLPAMRTNFDMYHRALEQNECAPTQEQKRAAAMATWTGGLLQEVGYSHITYVDDSPKRVIVDFVKPS